MMLHSKPGGIPEAEEAKRAPGTDSWQAGASRRRRVAWKRLAGPPLVTTLQDAVLDRANEAPVIIYSSRTHSQLQQAVRELKRTAYAHTVRSTVLGSRGVMCIHPTVSKIEDGYQQQLECRKLGSMCRRAAAAPALERRSVQISADRSLPRADRRHRNSVGILSDRPEKVDAVSLENLDIEELVAKASDGLGGELMNACPYYLSRAMGSRFADIIFMPYNYLLDRETRDGLLLRWPDAIVSRE